MKNIKHLNQKNALLRNQNLILKIAVSLILYSTPFYSQEWEWVNPKPQGNLLYTVNYISKDTLVSVGLHGAIIQSTNGGASWNLKDSKIFYGLISHCFINKTTGFAVGYQGTVLKTTDKGNTWTKISTPTTDPLYSISFINETTGYAVGYYGTTIKTVDGGDSWTLIYPGPHESLNKLLFVNDTLGFAVGRKGELLKTVNGGVNWDRKTTGATQDLNDIYMVSVDSGFAIGNYGTLITTSNGGESWHINSLGVNSLESILFLDDLTGYIVGGSGTFYKTLDGGVTWNSIDIGIYADFRDIKFFNNNNGVIVGQGGSTIITDDGGAHWTNTNEGTISDLYSMQFIDKNNGFIVGKNGTILKTSDTGNSWDQIDIASNETFGDVSFINNDIGYILSYEGSILKTSDKGYTWDTVSQGLGWNLSIKYVSEDTGFIVKSDGKLLSTVNGGTTWNRVDETKYYTSTKVYFATPDTGYCICKNGWVFRTYNRGVDWTRLYIGKTVNIIDASFVNGKLGYVITEGNEIFRTVDAGETWTAYFAISCGGLFSVDFSDSLNGYIIGNAATLIHTTDGGKTWVEEEQLSAGLLDEIEITKNAIFIIGDDGLIIKKDFVLGPYCDVDKNKIVLGHTDNRSETITISSNTNWTFSSDETWLSPLLITGYGDSIITCNADEYTGSENRTAYITISGESFEGKTIQVVQYGQKNQTSCEIVGVYTADGDSTMIVTINAETGIPTIHRQINQGFVMEEFPGVFNPDTRNFVEYGCDYGGDYYGLFKFNFDEGGISKFGDTNCYFYTMAYDYDDNKIYGIANYWYEVDSDSTFVVEVDDVSGTVTKLFNIYDTLEIAVTIYTYNPNTKNFISYSYNEFENYYQTVNVKTGEKYINPMPEDIMALFYDIDSNSVYGLVLVSDSLIYFKVDEITGEQTYIKNLGESIINYPWPYDLGAYNQENKTLYYPTVNDLENDQTLFMINLETGEMTENDSLEAKYGGYLGLIQYVCPIENEECTEDIYIEMNVGQCEPFISPSRKYTWVNSGNYSDTIRVQGACDTIYNISLIINNKTNSSIEVSACGAYVSPSGKVWTTTGNYIDTIPNCLGCDSIIMIHLTIPKNTSSEISVTSCSNYISPSGNYIWTESGTYYDTILNIFGCDSIITVNLLINHINKKVVVQNNTLLALQKDAIYKWLDCDNGYIPLKEGTNQWCTVYKNGNYAVEITTNLCKDTSSCVSISSLDINSDEFSRNINIYPNPTKGMVKIELDKLYDFVAVSIIKMDGLTVETINFESVKEMELSFGDNPGYYFVKVITLDKVAVFKVLKE